jgi:hypothetical protein
MDMEGVSCEGKGDSSIKHLLFLLRADAPVLEQQVQEGGLRKTKGGQYRPQNASTREKRERRVKKEE